VSEKLVIIGSGMATARLLESLADNGYGGAITVIGDEMQASYNRVLLSSVLAGEKNSQDLPLLDISWYRQHQVELITGETVVFVDSQKQQVKTHLGTAVDYDKLVFATGSRAHIPNIPGVQGLGVLGFRSLKDLDAIRRLATTGKRAVVVGGGLLGLEAAHGLNTLGVDVTVIHRRAWPMNRQLDAEAGALLQERLEQRGIGFVLSASPVEVSLASGQVSGIFIDSGDFIDADMVVFAAGIDPNKELAAEAGIACNRAIVANEFMQTRKEGVYALGECAEINDMTFGLVAPVWQQADVLARELAGVPTSGYCYEDAPTQLKVSGIDLFSAGNIDSGDEIYSQVMRDKEQGIYRRLIFTEDRLTGAILLGDRSGGTWYDQLIQSAESIDAVRPWLMFGSAYAAAG